MSSCVVEGVIWHARLSKAKHTFEYPVYFFELDADELPQLNRKCFIFGLNRWNVLSLRERDYLIPGDSKSLRGKVETLLAAQNIPVPASIQVVTQLRYWGWVFNPVSFFFCRDAAGGLTAVIADVNNTFGDGHAYVLKNFNVLTPGCLEARTAKVFHVSPFFERRGEYRFEFDFSRSDAISIVLDYYEDGLLLLASSWKGKRSPFATREIFSILCRYPFGGWLTLLRIHIQAFILYFVKKLAIYSRPEPDHQMTLRRKKKK